MLTCLYTRLIMPPGEQGLPHFYKLTRTHFVTVTIVSAVYFADIFLKASHKLYWFDELFTVYLCRLPHFSNIWTAVLHGTDFNPPLFYLLTRLSQHLFGNGLVATRLPATIGVWAFGVCLFLFVARHAGVVCGSIAGLFPFFTLAQYYAYEARAHGAVLGWCGLALVCWQRQGEGGSWKLLWLSGFGLSLLGALLTHVYAVYLFVPFAFVEFCSLLRRNRLDWGVLSAMALALTPVVVLVYLPLFRTYRSTVPSGFFVPTHDLFQSFLVAVFGPAIWVILLAIVFFGLEGRLRAASAAGIAIIFKRDMLVAIGFVCIPALGFLGSRISGGPFIDRYFLSSIAGFAIFLAYAHASRPAGSWCGPALAGGMLFLMTADLGLTLYLVSASHRMVLVEPSTRVAVNTTPSDPMRMYPTLSMDKSGLDILVLSSFDYFYFFEYSPRSVSSRLYFAAPPKTINYDLYQKFEKWGPVDFKTTTLGSFLSNHAKFRVYGGKAEDAIEAMKAIADSGYRLTCAQGDAGGIMYEFEK